MCGLLLVASKSVFAQTGSIQNFLCFRENSSYADVLSRAYQIPVVKNNVDFIQTQMDKYNFTDMDAIAYVLYKEDQDNGFLDALQNDRARRGMLKYGNTNFTMISPDLARSMSFMENESDVAYLEKIYEEDLELLRQGIKPESRNASGSFLAMGGPKTWYFSTLGPAQINLYVAFIMLKENMILNDELLNDIYSFNYEDQLDLHRLASQLVNEKVNIEFLVAYLKWAYEVYNDKACLNLHGKLNMVWELHTMGWFEYYAQNRYSECQCENQN